MSTIFVSAVDGSNADNGTTWALAKQTVAGALAIATSGDIIVVDNAGTFTANAALTWTVPAGNIAIISATRSGTTTFVPSAGATEALGAASFTFLLAATNAASVYIFGMTIKGGTNNSTNCSIGIDFTGNATMVWDIESCTFDIPSVAGCNITLGRGASTTAAPSLLRMINCTYNRTGSNTSQYIIVGNIVAEIINPTFSFAGASKPAFLTGASSLVRGSLTIRDGDISGYNVSGGTLIQAAQMTHCNILLENLKLSATPTIISGTWAVGTGGVTIRNCDSGNTTHVFEFINAYGTLTADNTVYITSGGAVFNGGGASWKIITTSLCDEWHPFILPLIYVWDTALTAQTASIDLIRDNATALTDRDIWSDLDSAASASFPNYTYQTNRNAQPFTGSTANQPTSTATWTGTGGFSNPTKQKLQNAFTAAATGLLQSRVYVGKASETLYMDPFIGGVG
jgi:hypothetical protein